MKTTGLPGMRDGHVHIPLHLKSLEGSHIDWIVSKAVKQSWSLVEQRTVADFHLHRIRNTSLQLDLVEIDQEDTASSSRLYSVLQIQQRLLEGSERWRQVQHPALAKSSHHLHTRRANLADELSPSPPAPAKSSSAASCYCSDC